MLQRLAGRVWIVVAAVAGCSVAKPPQQGNEYLRLTCERMAKMNMTSGDDQAPVRFWKIEERNTKKFEGTFLEVRPDRKQIILLHDTHDMKPAERMPLSVDDGVTIRAVNTGPVST